MTYITQLPKVDPRNSASFISSVEQLLERLPQFSADLQNLQVATNDDAASVLSQARRLAEQTMQVWNAAQTELLAGINKSIHVGSVIRAFVYDTANDSDGGAWRDRCQQTSWYQEPINGAWLGQCASIPAAWALSGAVAGAYFQNSTDGKFYSLTGTNSAVETFRGNARKFPAKVAVIAETSRIVIYDLTQAACPMWMVFKAVQDDGSTSTGSLLFTTGIKTVHCINGRLLTNITPGSSFQALVNVDFISDSADYRVSAIGYGYLNSTSNGSIAQRHQSLGRRANGNGAISNAVINALDVVVLPDAPINAATGLPTPTIAVANDGGVDIVRHDGSTITWLTNAGKMQSIIIDKSGLFVTGGDDVAYGSWYRAVIPATNTNTFDYSFNENSIPKRAGTDANSGKFMLVEQAGAHKALGSATNANLTLFADNPSAPANAMQSVISNRYATGWQVGDIRRCLLADTVSSTLAAKSLVVNGDFSQGTTGWYQDSAGSPSMSVNAGVMTANTGTVNNILVNQNINVIVGEAYRLEFEKIGTTQNAIYTNQGILGAFNSNAGVTSLDVVAVSPTLIFSIAASSSNNSASFKNLKCRLIESDRSTKNTGLVVSGAVVKSPVATGAQLVGYSGFSTSNYFDQPYTADLDFGVGNFCVMGWINPSSTANQGVFTRCAAGVSAGLLGLTITPASMDVYIGAGSPIISGSVPSVSAWSHFAIVRDSGIVYLYVNGRAVGSVANTSNITDASAKLCVGAYGFTGSPTIPFSGSLSLFKFGASAPFASQVARIYRDELALFQPNSMCTLDGAGANVRSLDYDKSTDLLHVGTAWGRSSFNNLERVESEASTVGVLTSIASTGGILVQAGANARCYQPALNLRDELARKSNAKTAFGTEPVFIEFDSVAAQTTFSLPRGYSIKAVYLAGVLKRQGATKDYVITAQDGIESAKFGVAPAAASWVSIMCVRGGGL